MAQKYSGVVAEMVERAGELTAEEVDSMGTFWTSEEGLSFVHVHWNRFYGGELAVDANRALQDSWIKVSEIAAQAGRAEALEAARDAERAVNRCTRHLHDTAVEKVGAMEAARVAVLVTGVRDVIEDADYQLLIAPWQHAIGV